MSSIRPSEPPGKSGSGRRNKYPSTCTFCSCRVAPGEGFLLGKDEATGRWDVECESCRQFAGGASRETPETDEGDDLAARLRAAQKAREADAKAAQARTFEEWYRKFREEIRRGPWFGDDPDPIRTASGSIPRCFLALGLIPPVDEGDVKRRFRELAKQHHPDRGGDPKRFIEIEKSYREALQLAGRAS